MKYIAILKQYFLQLDLSSRPTHINFISDGLNISMACLLLRYIYTPLIWLQGWPVCNLAFLDDLLLCRISVFMVIFYSTAILYMSRLIFTFLYFMTHGLYLPFVKGVLALVLRNDSKKRKSQINEALPEHQNTILPMSVRGN